MPNLLNMNFLMTEEKSPLMTCILVVMSKTDQQKEERRVAGCYLLEGTEIVPSSSDGSSSDGHRLVSFQHGDERGCCGQGRQQV